MNQVLASIVYALACFRSCVTVSGLCVGMLPRRMCGLEKVQVCVSAYAISGEKCVRVSVRACVRVYAFASVSCPLMPHKNFCTASPA